MASSVNGTYGLDWKVSSWRPDSVSRWSFAYNGGGNNDDIPAAIVVDSAFNIYVAGTIKSSGSNDIRVIKLDSAGNLKWGTNYNRTGSADDVGTGLAVVGGSLWVSGHSQQSTGNYDYTLLKYDTAGTLSWSRHRNSLANMEDYSTALAVRTNGNAYVTGNAKGPIVTSLNDMMTVCYSSDGTLQWTTYYGGTAGQPDYANDVKIDASGNVIVAGQTFESTDNSDLVLVKYTPSGSQSWAAVYSGSALKHDAANALIVGSDGYYYVTGFTETSGATNNYVTVRYNSSGTVSWAQTYDGPGKSTDEACAILEDGSDIVITGKSKGGGTGLDVCTISMVKSSGSVNWTMRRNSTTDIPFSIARDEMGNILVSHNETSGSAYINSCIKYHQKSKNDIALKKNLEVLAVGFSDLKTDTVFKRVIWYNILRAFEDSIYVMYVDYLRGLADAAGVTATSKVNTKIATFYGWNSGYNWADIKSKQMWNSYGRTPPMMGVPLLYDYMKASFISASAEVAFTHNDYSYPLPCVTCGDSFLDTADVRLNESWVFFISIPSFIYYPKKQYTMIVNCILGASGVYPVLCEICPPASSSPYTNLSGGGSGNHEIGIWVDFDDVSGLCGSVTEGNPYDLIFSSDLSSSYYAKLHALPGTYWRKSTDGFGNTDVRKSAVPAISDQRGMFNPAVTDAQYATQMSLCKNENLFHDFYEQAFMHLDFGGIYKISRPSLPSSLPMYFYFSPFRCFTYIGAPDMGLNYGGSHDLTSCGNGNHSYTQETEIRYGANGDFMTTHMALPNGDEYLANPSLSFLQSYWHDNVIAVGFVEAMGNGVAGNFVEFYADNSASTCDPLDPLVFTDLVSTTPVMSLTCYSSVNPDEGSGYEVLRKFPTAFPQLTRFLIHVQARFANGEAINQCQYLATDLNLTAVGGVGSMIRGNILDYNPSVVNYQIDIYEAY